MRSKQAYKDEDEEEEVGEEEEKDEGEDEEEGDNWVDDEGTKQIEQCVSSAEFVRLMRQNWIRENLPAAIQRDVESVVEHHQNALTSAAVALRPSAAEQEEEEKDEDEEEDEEEEEEEGDERCAIGWMVKGPRE